MILVWGCLTTCRKGTCFFFVGIYTGYTLRTDTQAFFLTNRQKCFFFFFSELLNMVQEWYKSHGHTYHPHLAILIAYAQALIAKSDHKARSWLCMYVTASVACSINVVQCICSTFVFWVSTFFWVCTQALPLLGVVFVATALCIAEYQLRAHLG